MLHHRGQWAILRAMAGVPLRKIDMSSISRITGFRRLAAAVGAILAMGGGGAAAATFDLGLLPTDGTTLALTGTTRASDRRDIYNFTLAESIGRGALTEFLRLETVEASFDTVIELFDAADLGGRLIAVSDDNRYTPCGRFFCSTISAGSDPGPVDMVLPGLSAGDYSLLVRGYAAAFGDYTLEITSRQDAPVGPALLSAPLQAAPASAPPSPVPLPAPALLLLGGLAAAAALRWRAG
jgi:hypothetical protein